jgi:hypothetical protein
MCTEGRILLKWKYGADIIHVAQDRDQWRDVLNTEMNLHLHSTHQRAGKELLFHDVLSPVCLNFRTGSLQKSTCPLDIHRS